jgi:hypothetical protein
MSNTNYPPSEGHNEDKYFRAQMKKVYAAFFEQPKTMLMVERETGIMRSNVCWYVRKWRNLDRIHIVKLGICPESKYSGVQYLTTDPSKAPQQRQLTLF